MSGEAKLYTTQQAAIEIGISHGHLRTLVVQGKATPKTVIGGTLMFDEAEIEKVRQRPKQRRRKSK